MRNKLILLCLFQFILIVYMKKSRRGAEPSELSSPKRENPNFVRDRNRGFSKPDMPPSWGSRYRQLYDPAWMDYCDPYHCDDYHRRTCGLNRRSMRFKWFQSICHLILNNQCASFRGLLKYDSVEPKFCRAFVMYLRAGCPKHKDCPKDLDPICAISLKDNHIVKFKNRCYLEATNCQNATLQEYEPIYMDFCDLEYY